MSRHTDAPRAKKWTKRPGLEAAFLVLLVGCAVLVLTAIAHAGDCGSPGDCRYIPDNSNKALPVAAAGAGAAVGIGLRRRRAEPKFWQPREPGRAGITDWDPSIDEQRKMWEQNRLIWDGNQWRTPRPDEVPPVDPPEDPTPVQGVFPRDRVPVDCLDVYDAYVSAQRDALDARDRVQGASGTQSDAQDYLNKLLARFTLLLGTHVGMMVAQAFSGVRGATKAATEPTGLGPRDTWSPPKGPPGRIARAIAGLMERLGALRARLGQLMGEIKELGDKIVALRQTAESLAEAAKAALARVTEELEPMVEAAQARVQQAQDVLDRFDAVRALRAQYEALYEEIQPRLSAINQRLQQLKAAEDWFREQYNQWLFNHPFLTRGMPLSNEYLELEHVEHEMAQLKGLGTLTEPQQVRLAELESRASQLDQLLHDAETKYGSLDDYLRRADPDKFQALTGGRQTVLDYGPALDAERQALETERQTLSKQLDRLDDQISEAKRGVPGGVTRDSLQADLAAAQSDVEQCQQNLAAAQQEAASDQAQAEAAAQAVSDAEADLANKQADRDRLQDELAKVEAEANQPSGDAGSGSGDSGVGGSAPGGPAPDAGGEAPPDPSQAGFGDWLLHLVRSAKNVPKNIADSPWESGETPEQITNALMSARNNLAQAIADLRQAQAEYDDAMSRLRQLKPQLDQCIDEHTPSYATTTS